MTSTPPGPSNPGRIAGLWYLAITLLGPIRLLYIPAKLFVPNDAAATVNNVAAHELLIRVGILADLLSGVVLIFLVLAFYRLFEGVDQHLAVLVVILGGIMPALIDFVGVIYDAGALMAAHETALVAHGGDFMSLFDASHRQAIAILFLNLRERQNTAAELLWGVWLLPLALLIYRSRFLPRFIGVWVSLNGLAYIVGCFTGWLAPQYQARVFNASFPILFGEIALMLWLLIKGARPPQVLG